MIVQLSLQLTLPTTTSDYLVPCGETHLTNSSAKSFIPTPPPIPPFSKCHVTFPYFYFHLEETACSSNFKEAQIPVDFSVPTKQVLTGVEHKLREKGRWLHWHSSPISLTAPARLLRFFCYVPSMNLLVSQIMCFLHPFLCLLYPQEEVI